MGVGLVMVFWWEIMLVGDNLYHFLYTFVCILFLVCGLSLGVTSDSGCIVPVTEALRRISVSWDLRCF